MRNQRVVLACLAMLGQLWTAVPGGAAEMPRRPELTPCKEEPVRVELTDPETGRPEEVRLARSGVAQTLRYMLYTPADAALLPLTIHLAAQGDWKPLAFSARFNAGITGAEGFYQSVSCAEDVALVRDGEIAAAVAGTALGDFRIRRQKVVCEGWRDPVTPASNGERVARTLKRARHLVIADGAHGKEGMDDGCFYGLIAAFLEAGAVEGLDTSCAARMRRPDFFLTLASPR